MPWAETKTMDLRICFIAACLRAEEPMSRLCERYGISRKTGYKWLERYKAGGARTKRWDKNVRPGSIVRHHALSR